MSAGTIDPPRGYVLRAAGKVKPATLRTRPAEHWARELATLLELGAGERWIGPEGAPLGNGGAAGSLLDRGAILIADKPDRWGHRGKDKRYRLTPRGVRIAKAYAGRQGTR